MVGDNLVKVHASGTHQLEGELDRRAAYFNILYSRMKYTLRGIKAEIRGFFCSWRINTLYLLVISPNFIGYFFYTRYSSRY